jgi:hypothetical protein
MRASVAGVMTACGLLALTAGARAAPKAIDLPSERPGVVQVWGGCGWGWHPIRYINRWGHWRVRCVPNRW